jgi:SAM-dependent methyltransferase
MAFDVAAESYDKFMGRHAVKLAPGLAELAGVHEGQTVLDVGCGPGALTGELVRRVGADAVAAVDPSESFVAAARERHPGVDVRRTAAEELPYPDGAFDAAIAQLVVHFMAEPVAGLAEMARVTRPGGVVAACVWDLAGGRAPISPFWRAARSLQNVTDDESGMAGTRAGHLVELFELAGLGEVVETELASDVDFATFDEWWEPFTFGVGPVGVYTRKLDEAAVSALRDRCRQLLPKPPFTLHSVAWAVRGVVAG